MKGLSYYTSGPFVAFAYNLDTQEIIKASCRPGAASIGQADYAMFPLCDRCTQADYELVRDAALAELGLVDEESIHVAAIAEYEARQEATHFLYA